MRKKPVKTLAIIQARASSSRLPGKVLKPILGKPMIELHIERIQRCKNLDKLIVATSDKADDDAIEKLCKKIGIFCFRGSLNNVLDRFYQAACYFKPEHIVRLTGDCPLADPLLIDDLIDFYFNEKCDYACNDDPPTLPDGLDAEIFSFDALKKNWEGATLRSEFEHPTLYFFNHPDKFKRSSWQNPADLSHMRWTVDEPEDFEFVEKIFTHLYEKNPRFDTNDILNILAQYPDLSKINNMFTRNEGLEKSLRDDQLFMKNN
ncbi:MAG: glycosyltransferase family protein [Desulfobacula sp.]|jgi:spore coat polysaccharide biosynthesis protein SpsF (cytidylyltransferase family)